MNQLEYYMSKPDEFEVKKHKKEDLYLIGYRKDNVKWSNSHDLEAGGLVLDGESNVVSRTYRKMFNQHELRNRIDLHEDIKGLSEWRGDRNDYTVMEKLDGYLAVVSQYNGKILYTSVDNFYGALPHKFKVWFDRNLTPMQKRNLKNLTKENTLLFEYISPENNLTVDYPKKDMVLHGIINTKTGKEILEEIVFESIADSIGVSTASRFNMGQPMLMRILEREFDEDLIEGFVVKFNSGKILKLQTNEYLKRRKD